MGGADRLGIRTGRSPAVRRGPSTGRRRPGLRRVTERDSVEGARATSHGRRVAPAIRAASAPGGPATCAHAAPRPARAALERPLRDPRPDQRRRRRAVPLVERADRRAPAGRCADRVGREREALVLADVDRARGRCTARRRERGRSLGGRTRRRRSASPRDTGGGDRHAARRDHAHGARGHRSAERRAGGRDVHARTTSRGPRARALLRLGVTRALRGAPRAPARPRPRARRRVDGAAGGAACGDLVRISVRVEGDRVADAGFDASGCGAAIAAGSRGRRARPRARRCSTRRAIGAPTRSPPSSAGCARQAPRRRPGRRRAAPRARAPRRARTARLAPRARPHARGDERRRRLARSPRCCSRAPAREVVARDARAVARPRERRRGVLLLGASAVRAARARRARAGPAALHARPARRVPRRRRRAVARRPRRRA